MCSSVISVTPFFWQVSNSDAFIRREAFEMSGLSAPTHWQNRFIPPPVPVDSISGDVNSGLLRAKLSETALGTGKTGDEPTDRIEAPEPEAAFRSEERRVGKEGVKTSRDRWAGVRKK